MLPMKRIRKRAQPSKAAIPLHSFILEEPFHLHLSPKCKKAFPKNTDVPGVRPRANHSSGTKNRILCVSRPPPRHFPPFGNLNPLIRGSCLDRKIICFPPLFLLPWHVTNDPSGFWMDSTNRKNLYEFSLKIEKLFSILEQKYIEVTVSYNQEDRSRDFTSCEMS